MSALRTSPTHPKLSARRVATAPPSADNSAGRLACLQLSARGVAPTRPSADNFEATDGGTLR